MAKKILVADDQEKCRAIHRERLEEAGYSVHVVGSGREAATVLQSDQDLDGAVLDNNMPPGHFGLMVFESCKGVV